MAGVAIKLFAYLGLHAGKLFLPEQKLQIPEAHLANLSTRVAPGLMVSFA